MNLPLSNNVYKKLPEGLLKSLDKKSIFLTGGTGFIGKWFLDLFQWVRQTQGIDFKLSVMSRNPEKFRKENPELTEGFHFTKGDVRFPFLDRVDSMDYVIHGATSTDASLNKQDPFFCFDTVVNGTRNTLEAAKKGGAKKFLFLSSGAVYGRQSLSTSHQCEEGPCDLDLGNPNLVYHEAKRAAEMLCTLYSETGNLSVKSARCYAFVGPFLPLDQHFAVGNFIKNFLEGETLLIKGDGSPLRSYMYPSDLVSWLLTILIEGESNKAYNVGSPKAYSIYELAKLVMESGDEVFEELGMTKKNLDVKVLQPPSDSSPERYVPSTDRFHHDFGRECFVSTKQAIKETIKWHLTQT